MNKHLFNRAAFVILAVMVVLAAVGYSLCTGYVIRGSILWAFVATIAILIAAAIKSGGRKQTLYRQVEGADARLTPMVQQPVQAYPTGTVNGDYSLMSYRGRPFNWVDYDPTTPDMA